MSNLTEHPGYLGLTSQGVIAIHADWPIYPVEHGWEMALQTLGQFPRGAALYQIDNIDQCLLLIFGDPVVLKDPFHSKHLHAAIWHEDLFELHKRDYVCGSCTTLDEWVEKRRSEFAAMFWIDCDGIQQCIPAPTIEDFADEQESLVLMIHDVGVSLTDAGWSALDEHLSGRRDELHPSLKLRSLPIVAIGQFDTAVREACLLLETRLRHIVGSDKYGQALVSEVDAYLRSSRRFISAQLKMLNGELRTAFKFVRNPYMHGLRELTSIECFALLGRISQICVMLDEVEQILSHKP